jgi:hypothetical protein
VSSCAGPGGGGLRQPEAAFGWPRIAPAAVHGQVRQLQPLLPRASLRAARRGVRHNRVLPGGVAVQVPEPALHAVIGPPATPRTRRSIGAGIRRRCGRPVERASAVTGASHRRSGRPRRVYVPGVRVAWHDTGACPCARGLPSGARWWPTARCTASGDGRSWLSEPRCRADIAGSLRIQRSPTTRTPGRARCSGQEKLRVLPHSTVQM